MNNQHSKIAGLNTYVGKTVPSFSSPKHFAKIVLVVLSCSREEHLYVFILYSNLPRITACSSPNINLWYQFAIYILYTEVIATLILTGLFWLVIFTHAFLKTAAWTKLEQFLSPYFVYLLQTYSLVYFIRIQILWTVAKNRETANRRHSFAHTPFTKTYNISVDLQNTSNWFT